jgi:fatty aldehyde decarbonylase
MSDADERRFDLLCHIFANVMAAEILAIENDSQMVHLLPTAGARIEMVNRATAESRHAILLTRLARDLALQMPRRLVEPLWQAIRRQFSAAIAREDLAACLIIQDVIAESMIIPLYERLALSDDLDARAAGVAGNILCEVHENLEIGTWRLRTLLSEDSEAVSDALRWAHHRVMPALSTPVAAAPGLAREIEALWARRAERYGAALQGLFDSAVVRPLLAGLAAMGRPVADPAFADACCIAPGEVRAC